MKINSLSDDINDNELLHLIEDDAGRNCFS